MIDVFLLFSAVCIFILTTVLSQRVRAWADFICFGLAGLCLYNLLVQFGSLRVQEWNVFFALLFTMSFSLLFSLSSKKSQLFFADALRHSWKAHITTDSEGLFNNPLATTDLEQRSHEDRIKTLGLMVAQLIHELNHPLSTLHLRIEEIRNLDISQDSKKIEKSIQSIDRQVKYLTEMTKSFRRFGSLGNQGETGYVALTSIFEMVKDLSGTMTVGTRVNIRWPRALPAIVVSGGLTQQTQVLVNLIKNAIDAVSELNELKQRWIAVDISEKGGSVEIAVSNGGPTLSRKIQSNLFKPFLTSKRRGAGMGVGLSLSRDLVESMGGDIWYDERARHPRFVVSYSYLPAIEECPQNSNDFQDDLSSSIRKAGDF